MKTRNQVELKSSETRVHHYSIADLHLIKRRDMSIFGIVIGTQDARPGLPQLYVEIRVFQCGILRALTQFLNISIPLALHSS